MMQRYLFIEPNFSDPDTFCNVTVGSGRIRANIQIYVNESMLTDVVWALKVSDLNQEHPQTGTAGQTWFGLDISVLPVKNGYRYVRFRIYQTMLEDGAPFTADIQLALAPNEAMELANDLAAWLERKEDYTFSWKG
ncbi:MAG TPA: hypothetical protein PLI73_07180 [Candidatus Cloacimonadota bacterium]|nr:hypothetical protein [Candidatus Cloacimonadota bacterium]